MALKRLKVVSLAVLFVTMTSMNASAAAITDDLLAYWQFDETSGMIADDWVSTSTDFDGTLVGDTSFVTGKFGNAVTFDGTYDYIDVANQLIPTAASSYSVSAWFNVADGSLDGTRRMIFETSGSWASSLELSNANNKLKYSVQVGSGAVKETAIQPTTSEWHFVVLTYDSETVEGTTTGTTKVYYDGAEITAASLNTTGTLAASTGFHFGTYRDANTRFFKGLIDDSAVWGRALDDSDVALLWNDGVGFTVEAATVPEPSVCFLALTGLLGILIVRRQK